MRYTGPKNRLARREGLDLGLKTVGSKAHASLLRRINIKPGQKQNVRFGKLTEYGKQLREKQKLCRIYGITESKLKRYYEGATQLKGNTSEHMVQSLEARLDNVVFRLGFAPTRASARQLVNHGHFLVNGKKVSIPSYLVKSGDVIEFRKEETKKIPYISEVISKKDVNIPEWLDRKATLGKVIDKPDVDAIGEDVNMQAVIEFYSR